MTHKLGSWTATARRPSPSAATIRPAGRMGQPGSQDSTAATTATVFLLQQGRYAAALPEFEQAERAHPQNAAIENVLGIIESKLGHWQVADQHYQKAIRLAPKLEEAHKNLGFNYLTEGLYPLAEEQLKTAIALDPGDAFAHYYLARLYLATHHDRQAVKQLAPLQQILQNDPQHLLRWPRRACG